MARQGVRLYALIVSGALAFGVACETNHDALEKQPRQGNSAGGAGGVAGGGAYVTISGGGGSVASGGHADDEAPGKTLLTIVHGVVDAPRIVLCLAKVGADGAAVPFGKPLSAAPLAYGQSVVLPAIANVDFASDTLQPFVIAGELDLISKLDCAAAIDRARAEEAAVDPSLAAAGGAAGAESAAGAASSAGGSSGEAGASGTLAEAGTAGSGGADGAAPAAQARLRVRSLPTLPAGTLSGGRSYLLVAAGCLGGSGYELPKAADRAIGDDTPTGEDYCGTGYTAQTPTVSLFFAAVSRASAEGHVGLQVLNGSLATDPISVNSSGPLSAGGTRTLGNFVNYEGTPISIASGVVAGGLAPRPADIDHSALDYGSALGFSLGVTAQRKIQSSGVTQEVTVLSETWASVLDRSGVGALADGSNYVLVLLGPLPDAKQGPAFLNPPVLTAVRADAD
jgi:hypothetical protein